MQARKNKYQRDNRGHIIDDTQGKKADKVMGKAKVDAVATKNKFAALELEEVDQPTLRITEGKGEDKGNDKKKAQVNPRKPGEILAIVDGVLVYDLRSEQVEDVNMEVLNYTVGSHQQTVDGKGSDPNGTVKSGRTATVIPRLGSVYELQFWMMQDDVNSMEQKNMNEELDGQTKGQLEQAIIPRTSGDLEAHVAGTIETSPMACASGTGQPMQIQLNIPIKSPIQVLHDLVTHNVTPMEIQAVGDQEQFEEESDDESTAGNFKAIARDVDLSPRAGDKGGKKTRKQGENKENPQPKIILPKRAASQTK
ncbi:hypothetical protein A4A49_12600 [Nicotiana attenuata]|uniref:Uncharacterized protein n=1 Tax=Nicotiana attenuata TaxID=49451 RepID=A0A314KMQ0_NICAT|nr:hypothetical protein A4A49_12600 [Nicotiana attenuata]